MELNIFLNNTLKSLQNTSELISLDNSQFGSIEDMLH